MYICKRKIKYRLSILDLPVLSCFYHKNCYFIKKIMCKSRQISPSPCFKCTSYVLTCIYIYILYSVTYRCVYIYIYKKSYLTFSSSIEKHLPCIVFENSEMPPRWPTPRPRLLHLEDRKPQRDIPGCKASPTQDDCWWLNQPNFKKICKSHCESFSQGFGVKIIKSLKFHQPEDY